MKRRTRGAAVLVATASLLSLGIAVPEAQADPIAEVKATLGNDFSDHLISVCLTIVPKPPQCLVI